MYNIRSKEGVLKAKVSNSVANKIIDNVDGFFREAIYKNGTKGVYEVCGHVKWCTDEFCIFVWEGDKLEKQSHVLQTSHTVPQ